MAKQRPERPKRFLEPVDPDALADCWDARLWRKCLHCGNAIEGKVLYKMTYQACEISVFWCLGCGNRSRHGRMKDST